MEQFKNTITPLELGVFPHIQTKLAMTNNFEQLPAIVMQYQSFACRKNSSK